MAEPVANDETPSAFTRRMADEVEKMIAGWEARGNYDRHLIQAEHLARQLCPASTRR
jgi:hypothetical protein